MELDILEYFTTIDNVKNELIVYNFVQWLNYHELQDFEIVLLFWYHWSK